MSDRLTIQTMLVALERAQTIEPLLMELGDCLDDERKPLLSDLKSTHRAIRAAIKAGRAALKDGEE